MVNTALALNTQEVNILFPFHFALNKQLKIISVGPSLQKSLVQPVLNLDFESVLTFKRPTLSIRYTFDSIRAHYNHLFILELLTASGVLLLRGQFLPVQNDEVLFFAGSPWLKETEDLNKFNLKVNDFAISDSITDLMHVLRAEKFAMEDVNYLANDLKKERDNQKQTIEFLFKEVHHRVKNNLQTIISLINIQKEYIKEQKTLDVFQDCQNRIYAMARIHEVLYANNIGSEIDIRDYIKKLVQQLIQTYQVNLNINTEIEVEVETTVLELLVPIALLANEIISNILKYAFEKNDESNLITFSLKKSENNTTTLRIGDNGKGSKVNLNEENNSFGMELIKVFTSQLNGKIKRLPVKGTMYEIVFPT